MTTAGDFTRLLARLDALAELTATPAHLGLTREAYTPLYAKGVDLVEEWMQHAGLQTRIDAAGNLFGRWPGAEHEAPVVLTGSHLDTTRNAGRLDGVYGVLGAIEAVESLRAAGHRPRRSIEVVAMTAEEPRFNTGCIGSRALVGSLSRADLDQLVDRDGVTLAEAMRDVGLDAEAIADARLPESHVAVFIELHIEQGPILEREGVPIGVVTAIAAPHDIRITLTGSARHAGSTPMGQRHDALLGAAEIALAVEAAALNTASSRTVATVGTIAVTPNANNVIPGACTFDVDVRDIDRGPRDAAVAEIDAAVREVSRRRGLSYTIEPVADDQPVLCDPLARTALCAACDRAGLRFIELASGAYHGSVVLATRMPVAMLFVPSSGGISHHPDEHTSIDALAGGVAVLANALEELTA